jgi:hypothetical protein
MMLQTAVPALQQQVVPTISPDTSAAAVVRTPLPGGVGAFVRTVMNAPSWLQITVIAVGAVIVLALLVWLWVRRASVLHWLRTRSGVSKIAMTAILIVAIAGSVGFGTASWNYIQHNNDFCVGCHVMGTAWTKFQHSEHRKLKCHDCHQQSIVASMRQLYLWVAERPNSIPAHSKVPTAVCQNCHNQEHPDSAWKRIMTTAGHRTHLNNANSKLRNVQCVTCHGAEVHHFVPIDKTCGQSGCHEDLQIKLGKMAAQTSLHCTGCHNFTVAVGENISPDSARTQLVPTGGECLDCHQMKQKLAATLAEFDPNKDPHKAVCGSCHNPHKQTTPGQSFETCATAQCHARPDTLTPFHRGLPKGELAKCGTCHQAHIWKVPSKDCVACHHDLDHPLRGAGARKPPPGHPLDDSSDPPVGGPFVPDAESETPAARPPQQQTPTDTATFTHARHKALQCSSCHSSAETHGAVTISRPAGCRDCHHSTEQKATCTTCHKTPPPLDETVSVAMTVWTAPRDRTLSFAHERHTKLECRTCHTAPGTLVAQASCVSCHGDHHYPTATCASCHPAKPIATQREHPRQTTHAGCSGAGCHRDAAVLALPATRSVCLVCHREQTNHKPGGDCGTCHLVTWQPNGGGR